MDLAMFQGWATMVTVHRPPVEIKVRQPALVPSTRSSRQEPALLRARVWEAIVRLQYRGHTIERGIVGRALFIVCRLSQKSPILHQGRSSQVQVEVIRGQGIVQRYFLCMAQFRKYGRRGKPWDRSAYPG
jgi:hypothetical protein